MYIITGILLGTIFEILFITVMFYKIKGLKDKKILLFIGTFITYFLSGFITSYSYNNQYLFYIIFNVIYFFMLKLIYKKNINIVDFFVIYYIGMIMSFGCLILMKIFGYNYLSYMGSRIIFTILMLISSKFNKLYKFYLYNWNRHKDNKIKSITTRNITIISCNLMLYIVNYLILNYFLKLIS